MEKNATRVEVKMCDPTGMPNRVCPLGHRPP
jgi:hypothetical protein